MRVSLNNRATGLLLAALALLASAGCRPAASTNDAPGTPTKDAPATQKAVQDVQNNPNIPPQAKANIARQMQGGKPPVSAPQ